MTKEINKIVDYDATLKRFFVEVVIYLENLRKNVRDESDHLHVLVARHRIDAAIKRVQRVAANPQEYTNYMVRLNSGLSHSNFADAFVAAGTHDDSVYLSFSAVVNSMGGLYSKSDNERKLARDKLLKAFKSVKIRNANDLFNVVKLRMRSPESIAVQKKQYTI